MTSVQRRPDLESIREPFHRFVREVRTSLHSGGISYARADALIVRRIGAVMEFFGRDATDHAAAADYLLKSISGGDTP